MHRRALHLASLLLLLSTLGMAEASVAHNGDFSLGSLGGHYITVLLAQQDAAAVAHTSYDPDSSSHTATALPATSLAQINTVWTMRPSAAHSVLQHAVTGSSL
jgi:hypothetical protein